MNKVKRYSPKPFAVGSVRMTEEDYGEYVLIEDYLKLEQECKCMEEKIKNTWVQMYNPNSSTRKIL